MHFSFLPVSALNCDSLEHPQNPYKEGSPYKFTLNLVTKGVLFAGLEKRTDRHPLCYGKPIWPIHGYWMPDLDCLWEWFRVQGSPLTSLSHVTPLQSSVLTGMPQELTR